MPSFDIVSKADAQLLDNAINVAHREVSNRFDFKGNHIVMDLDKKNMILKLEADSEMKMDQLVDVLLSKGMKQGLDSRVFDLEKTGQQSGKYWKKDVALRNGLKQEDAKKIVKAIKDSGAKVQAAIMDDTIRVTGKKIDDLQEVIALCKANDFKVPLQFVNMKS